MTTLVKPVHIREDRDLIGSRCAVLREECGHIFIDMSAAMFSLYQTDRPEMMENLRVRMPDGTEKWIPDIQGVQ